MTASDYTVSGYRYAKGKQCVRPVPNGSGWKTRAARFERPYAEGWDANGFTGKLGAPHAIPQT